LPHTQFGQPPVHLRSRRIPLAVLRLKTAISQMREYGLLGMNILGTGVNFNISVKEGAGSFCLW
jgi:NADH:ubiquinone oxidoreductase subunit F (NADH-binding)